MIFLHSTDGRDIVVNADEIEVVDSGHNSIISLKSGKKIIVVESTPEIVQKVIEYKKQCHSNFNVNNSSSDVQ